MTDGEKLIEIQETIIRHRAEIVEGWQAITNAYAYTTAALVVLAFIVVTLAAMRMLASLKK